MKPAVLKTQLRQAVGGSSLLRKSFLGALAIGSVAMLSSWIVAPGANAVMSTEYKFKIPLGLEQSAMVITPDNPMTTQKVELGRALFFDRRLSADNTIACASCHLAQKGFTDGQPVSTGIKGQRAAVARRHPLTACSAAFNFGTAGPPHWKINPSAPSRIQSNTVLLTTM